MYKNNEVIKISILGVIVNLSLIVMKLTVGIISKSQSMIADAIHSIQDVFASILTYIGANFSNKKKDDLHPYGHSKIEYIFSFLISIIMILSSLSIFKSIFSSIRSFNQMNFSVWLIIVCIINILAKLILFIYTRKKYNYSKDILIKASMEDHRNDIFLTSSTLLSVICGCFKLNIIDYLVGILIALRIIYIAIKIFMESFFVLIDTGLNQERIDIIYRKIVKCSSDIKIIDIISKPIGSEYILIIRIKIRNNINIKKFRKKIKKIKRVLTSEFNYISEVIIDIQC